MTIKVVGNQWYCSYTYPDQGDLSFASNVIPDKDLKPDQKRLLDVDDPLVVPVDTNIRVLAAGCHVLDSWFVPAFGDPVLRNAGTRQRDLDGVEYPGTFYGECNQICGINHAFMPIKVVAVAKPDFEIGRRGKAEIRLPAPPPAAIPHDAKPGNTKIAAVVSARETDSQGLKPGLKPEAHDGYHDMTPPATPSMPTIGQALSRAGCFRRTTRTSARCT